MASDYTHSEAPGGGPCRRAADASAAALSAACRGARRALPLLSWGQARVKETSSIAWRGGGIEVATGVFVRTCGSR